MLSSERQTDRSSMKGSCEVSERPAVGYYREADQVLPQRDGINIASENLARSNFQRGRKGYTPERYCKKTKNNFGGPDTAVPKYSQNNVPEEGKHIPCDDHQPPTDRSFREDGHGILLKHLQQSLMPYAVVGGVFSCLHSYAVT